ncbi:hypothetical protein [Bosea caraganae]|uniref:hypothetical protein n=1 Tax=Bosea caraganae TaxID=2763117 RepID=UPI0011C02427|nr:hypothetical protein [Bosea caraganae]
MRRSLLALALVPGLAGTGLYVGPNGWQSWQLRAAADDPAALSQIRLREVATPERIAAEIDLALAEADTELADSFVGLAQERGIVVAPEQSQRLATLKDEALSRAVQDFGYGFFMGERVSGAGFAGALTGDVIGFGDLRDLAHEGQKLVRGEAIDNTILALAGAGLVLSAATWVSLGGGLPARGGLSIVKSASKAGKLSPALTAGLARTAASAIDRPALKASLAAAAKLDLAGARMASANLIRPAAMKSFAALGQDTGTLYAKTGQRGLRQVLNVAEDAGDIGKAAKLSSTAGSKTRAILKLLGRSALVLGGLSLTAASWLLALVGWALAVAMVAQRLGWWLGRRLMPGPKRQAA